jgi:hypothetical protein
MCPLNDHDETSIEEYPMRTTVVLWTTVLLAFAAASVLAEDPASATQKPGQIVRVAINRQTPPPRAYHPKLDDIVQADYTYPVVPGAVLDNLLVHIEGDSLTLAGVVRTSDPQHLGVAAISAFLTPKSTTLAKVTFTPVRGGGPGVPITVDFLPLEIASRAAAPAALSSAGGSPASQLDAAYSAYQVPCGVVLVAQGRVPTTGYQVHLKQLPIDIWPPQYRLEIIPPAPGTIVGDIVLPFRATAYFEAQQAVKSVNVEDADGKHAVPVAAVVSE